MKQTWRETHNRTRRAKYAKDRTYKAKANKQNRGSYRSVNGIALRETAKENVGNEASFGKVRRVLIAGTETDAVTFSVRELASLLGRGHIAVYRWLAEKKFPRPNVRRTIFEESQARAFVYSLDQARALLAVIVKHQADKIYFDETDTETIASLFDVMES